MTVLARDRDVVYVRVLVISLLNMSLMSYFLGLAAFYVLFCLLGYYSVKRARLKESLGAPEHFFRHEMVPYISLLVPAYNEALTIIPSLRALCLIRYPNLQIIVVNDGSTDDTLNVLVSEMEMEKVTPPPSGTLPSKPVRSYYRSRLFPQVVLIDKQNGGKADSLNTALNHCTNELFCAVDADSLLEADSLLRITQEFVADPKCIAAGGAIRVVNGCEVSMGRVIRVRLPHTWLPRIQVVEYLRAFLFGRMGLASLNSLMIVSGAFGVFRTDAVMSVGGYEPNTVGEDMELIVRLHRRYREEKRGYTMTFVPTPICWTEVPVDTRVLARQRARWHKGLFDSLMRHKSMFLNPTYGAVGLIGYPYFLVFELFGPLVELLGYMYVPIALAVGLLNVRFAVWFFAVALLLGTCISVLAVLLETLTYHKYEKPSEVFVLLVAAVLENFGFRQATIMWRLLGMVQYLRGSKSWGAMERKGFGSMARVG